MRIAIISYILCIMMVFSMTPVFSFAAEGDENEVADTPETTQPAEVEEPAEPEMTEETTEPAETDEAISQTEQEEPEAADKEQPRIRVLVLEVIVQLLGIDGGGAGDRPL